MYMYSPIPIMSFKKMFLERKQLKIGSYNRKITPNTSLLMNDVNCFRRYGTAYSICLRQLRGADPGIYVREAFCIGEGSGDRLLDILIS